MATYTSNLNLKKPNDEDFYNIADFNGNADILDTAVAGKANKVTGGTEGNFVKLDANGDIADSGKSSSDLENAINTLNDLKDAFTDYLQNVGGYKKYTEAGTYTFKVPMGITSIKVSAIGGGGSGGSGGSGSTTYNGLTSYGGAGGGGGGRGAYIIDSVVNVTAGETLTVIVGAGSAGVNGSGIAPAEINTSGQTYYNGVYGNNGINGGSSYLKRGETTLVTVAGGNGGSRGGIGWASNNGGTGGTIGGLNGQSTVDAQGAGTGGSGGTTNEFGGYGNGGNGSAGGDGPRYSSTSSSQGASGALVICYGSYVYNNIIW